MIRSRIMSAAAAAAIAGGAFVALVPQSAGAIDTPLLICNAITSDAKLNPTLKSGDSKFIKASSSGTTGGCLAHIGLAVDQSTQDVKYLLDNQTNGNIFLFMLSNKASLSGSVSCNGTDTSLLTDYPASYPLQGKITWKYVELSAALTNLSTQMYVRGGRDPLDTNPTNFTLTGIVIKGVGVGGDVSATLSFVPDFASTKNLNFLDCLANPATQNASIADLDISQGDGSDADTITDSWVVTIPS